jgi:hypothetical protein
MLGYKQALLRMQASAKPGQPAREESLILAEGQRENGIEVLRIDEDSGQVSILNGATRMTLDFERNGIQAKGSPGSPMVLAQNRGATNPTTYRLLPSRMPRVGRVSATNAIVAPIPSPAGYSTPYLYSQTNPPTGSITGNVAAVAGLPVPTQTTSSALSLTPQDQVVLSELERAAAMESIRQQNQNPGTLPATEYPPMPDPAIPGSMGSAVPPFPPVNGY